MDLCCPIVPENRSNQCHLATDPSTCASVAMEIPPYWSGESMFQLSLGWEVGKWGRQKLLSSLCATGIEAGIFPLCRSKVCTRSREQLVGDSELTMFIKSSCLRSLMRIPIKSILRGFSGITSKRLRRRTKTPRPRSQRSTSCSIPRLERDPAIYPGMS